jgi:hypothetical protein
MKAPTLVFGGAEDSLPGSAALFRERMKFVAETIPDRNGRLHLIPGIGHVPHLEAPEKTYPPLVAFLKGRSRRSVGGARQIPCQTLLSDALDGTSASAIITPRARIHTHQRRPEAVED